MRSSSVAAIGVAVLGFALFIFALCSANADWLRPPNYYSLRAPVTSLGIGAGAVSFPSTPIVEMHRPITVDSRPTYEPTAQVGLLTSKSGEILPLMGRRFAENRGGRYEYYTVSGSHGMLSRLPVTCNGNDCSGEKGCDQLFSGDAVFTGATNRDYDVTMYDTTPYYRR